MASIEDPNRVHEPVADNLRDVTEGLSRLVQEHVELAKSELRANLTKVAFDASLTGVGAGLLLLGWVLLMVAAGFALGTILGDGLAFLIVAGSHLVVGAALVGIFGMRLKNKDKLAPEETQQEFARDRQFLHKVREMARQSRQLPA
jgi:membrane protein